MRFKNAVIGLALAVVFCSTVGAAPPTLTLPATVTGEQGDFLTVPATTTASAVNWLVLDPGLNLFPAALLKDTKTAVLIGKKPGSYRLLAIVADGGEITTATSTVVIQGPAPPAPAPAPTPAPPPTPAPAAAKTAWAIVILDNTQRTQAQAQLLNSQMLLTALQQRSIAFRVLDATDPNVASNGYQTAVTQAGGVPALVLLDAKAVVQKAIRLPADAASFLAAIPAQPAALAPAFCPSGNCPLYPR